MPGLRLQTGASGAASAKLGIGSGMGSGNYAPLTPAAANSPSAGTTIGQMAYGISGDGASPDSQYAGIGSTIVGAVSVALLLYVWYSLPR